MKVDFRAIQKKLGKKYIISIVLVFGVVLFGLLFSNVRQKNITIREGQLANETIRANKTIENKYETREKKRLAAESIKPEYTFDKEIGAKRVDLLDQLFRLINEVNQDLEKDYQKRKADAKDKDKILTPTIDEKVAALKKKFESINQDDISFYQSFPGSFYQQIFALSAKDQGIVHDEAARLVKMSMSKHVRSGNLTEAKQIANRELQALPMSTNKQQLIKDLLDRAIVINEVDNEKKTAELREEAKAKTVPVMIYLTR